MCAKDANAYGTPGFSWIYARAEGCICFLCEAVRETVDI